MSVPLVTEQTDALGGWKGRGSQPTLYNLASKGLVGTPLIRRVQNQISRRRSSFAPPCQELPKGGRTASQAVERRQTDVSRILTIWSQAVGVEPHPSVNSFGHRDALGGWKGRRSQPTLYNLASRGWVGTPLIRRVLHFLVTWSGDRLLTPLAVAGLSTISSSDVRPTF